MEYKDPDKQREYQRNWLHKRRLKGMKDLGPCVQCGETSIEKLQIHHKNKKFKKEHRIWSWSAASLKNELAKCEVRCTKCHADIHGLETLKPEHRTIARYKSKRYPCYCITCRHANTVNNNKWLKLKKLKE